MFSFLSSEQDSCDSESCDVNKMFQIIPWDAFSDSEVHFWVHYAFVILGFVLAVITVVVQWKSPAPYGKHANQGANWGPMIPQVLGHILSDAVPGILLFLLVFFLAGHQREPVNWAFLVLFEVHYIHRGLIHPLVMKYSSSQVALGITLGGFFPNCLFHGINADFVGSAYYANNYHYDPRFVIGLILFVIGFVINRHSDWVLRSLRLQRIKQDKFQYYIPRGGLFNFVTCPNYFGELIQWTGWAITTWSLAGVVWLLFSTATFFPRSKHNHLWYRQNFEDYPMNRRALIPFIF